METIATPKEVKKYAFATREFGLSEKGIHLLRSNYNYKTIDIKNVSSLEIKRGKLINNWVVILVLGIALLSFSVFYTIRLIELFNDDSIGSIYIEEIIVPLLPFFMGGYCIYASTRTGVVLTVQHPDSKLSLPLTELKERNEIMLFISTLKENPLVRYKLKVLTTE